MWLGVNQEDATAGTVCLTSNGAVVYLVLDEQWRLTGFGPVKRFLVLNYLNFDDYNGKVWEIPVATLDDFRRVE